MVFVCGCGKRFRAPEGTPSEGRACPRCGGTLRLAEFTVPGDPVQVHIEQKKALRDELRGRDRQLRIAQREIARLKLENGKLQAELDRARGGRAPVIAEAPVVINRSAGWKPMELPSERLDLALSPVLEELPDLSDAPQLPSDRLTFTTPEK
ncbi:MAG TPA: hypothetical protein VM222_06430 [Planctomycetota bacterium]|nr:hypothetical protein [Planctomycetota bacterium]